MVQQNNKGQIIIELLIAFGLAGILLPALLVGLIASRNGKVGQEQRIVAVGLLREGEEAVRSVRDVNWANITSPAVTMSDATHTYLYHPVPGSNWSLVSGSEVLHEPAGDFMRSIKIENLASPDPSLRKITIAVSWGSVLPSSTTSVIYLTRWKNQSYEPLIAEGPLGGIGRGDWCNPSLSANAKYYPIPGNSTGIAIYGIPGAALGDPATSYITTGENAASNPVYSLGISNPPYPTWPMISAGATNTDAIKGYKFFISGPYLYFTSDHPGKAVDIVNLSTLSPAGYFDDGHKGSVVGQNTSIFVSGNFGYLTSDTVFYTFDTSAIQGNNKSQVGLGSVSLAPQAHPAKGNKIAIYNGYAFIATTDTTNQLQVIDIKNPSSPGTPVTKNVENGKPGVDLALSSDGKYIYLVTTYSSSTTPDFFVIDVSNPTSPQVVATATTTNGMSPTGVATVPQGSGNAVIVVGLGGDPYQVFNITPPLGTTVPQCGKLTTTDLNGATQVNAVNTILEADKDAYSYILATTGNSNQQFGIIAGGPGGTGGVGSGVFESPIFPNPTPFSNPVVFNSFKEAPSPPPQPTGVITSYQVATSLNCTSFSYVGPDGTSATSYGPNGGAIPLGINNPGICFRYKVTFTGGGGAGNASTAVQINYSP
jgi:LVIVD repeat